MNKFLTLPTTVHLLCIGSLINRAGQMLVLFLTLYLTQHLGFSETFAGGCFAAFGVGAIFAALVGGHCADAIGRKVVMIVALIGGGGILVAFSFLEDKVALLSAIAAFAFVSEMYRPASQAMIADVVSPEQRPHAFTLMYLAINLGFALAAPIGALLIKKLSFQWLFWFDATTSGIFGLIILLTIRETLPGHAAVKAREGTSNQPDPAETEQVPWLVAFGRIVCDRVFIVFCMATFCIAMTYMQGMSTLPLYLTRLGMDAATYGHIIVVNGVMIVLLQIPITALVVRRNRALVLALSSLVTAIGFGLTAYARTPLEFRLTVMVWTMGEMMAVPLVSAIVADLAPARLRARYMGVFTMSFSGANTIAAPIGSFILVKYGGGVLWQACFAVGLVSALLYAVIGRSIAAPEPNEDDDAAEGDGRIEKDLKQEEMQHAG